VALRTSHPRDDSYTPSKISIRAGSSIHDLQEVSPVSVVRYLASKAQNVCKLTLVGPSEGVLEAGWMATYTAKAKQLRRR
jgi:hypothetical protein